MSLSRSGLCLLEDKQGFSLGEFDECYFGHVLTPILGSFLSDFLPFVALFASFTILYDVLCHSSPFIRFCIFWTIFCSFCVHFVGPTGCGMDGEERDV